MYKFENWTWCRCWLPLLGAIAGRHCWAAIAGDSGGGVGVHVGGLDVVPLLGAIAGCHCWVPLGTGGGGCTRWRIGRGGVAGCIDGRHCWVPLLGAIAGLPLLGMGGVGLHVGGLDVVTWLAAVVWMPIVCHCWVPLLDAIGGGGIDTL